MKKHNLKTEKNMKILEKYKKSDGDPRPEDVSNADPSYTRR